MRMARSGNLSSSVPAICTICSNPGMPAAQALMASVARFHPAVRRFVCLADARLPDPAFYDGPFELLEAASLRIPAYLNLAFGCMPPEFRAAVKPYLLEHLLVDRALERLFYLDPEAMLFAPLEVQAAALDESVSLLLVPRLYGPPDDEASHHEANGADFAAMRGGAFNPGFIGLTHRTETVEVLGWWKTRLQQHWAEHGSRSMFLTGKVLDLVLSFVPSVRVLHDKGVHRGPWGLSTDSISDSVEGAPDREWRIEGRPLVCFQFSGFDPARPGRLGTLEAAPGSPFAALLAAYASALPPAAPAALAAHNRFASGAGIAPVLRRMFREQVPDWVGDPFTSFEAYLHEPAPAGSRDAGNLLLTRLMHYLWELSPALRERWNPDTPEGLSVLTDWFVREARPEHGLDWRLIEPVAERLGRRSLVGRSGPPARSGNRPEISVVGYLRTASGVGTVARQTLTGLAASGRVVEGVDVALNVLGHRGVTEVEPLLRKRASGTVQIFANVNADQLPQVLQHLSSRLDTPAYRIAMPAWELETFPDAWLSAFAEMDEVWAQTPWIQRMLAPKLDKPVITMPVLLTLDPPPPLLARTRFGLPDDAFLFYFAFDFLSFVARKNPEAAVAAFQLLNKTLDRCAADRRPGLVVKVMNGAHAPDAYARFLELVADVPDVHLVDEVLTRADTLALTAACDCVVSLHRCEGLGLVVAEAMALGRPVIATDYAATADLLDPSTGFPVDCRLVEVPPGAYPMGDGQCWAEPDVEHAAWLMGFVMLHPGEAARRAEIARRQLEARHGHSAVVARQLARLAELAGPDAA